MSKDGYNATERVSTEWEDALVKHKIIERKKKAPTQDVVDTKIMWDEKEKEKHKYDNTSLDELSKLEDDIEEDVSLFCCFLYLILFVRDRFYLSLFLSFFYSH